MMQLSLSQKLLLMEPVLRSSAAEAMRKSQEHWHAIDWQKAHRIVRSLQRRIVAAVKAKKWAKVKSLQWILTHSFSAKVLAIRKVTENRGSRSSGIDGQRWNSPQSKWAAIGHLKRRGYKALAVRRVKIPKSKGKYRMLGIPTMRDRAMQALHLLALEPISETLADAHSYGFRKYRSCHDAIEQCYIVLSRKEAAQWILEGDIRACFDKISKEWMLKNIPMDTRILSQWLNAGYIDNKQWYPSEAGTPQGSPISPTIANMVLDGMAKAIDEAMNIRYRKQGDYIRRVNNPFKVHFIRYADDWLVTAKDKTVLEEQVKPAITAFLKERGLSLSEEKTVISHIKEGVNFLGQTLRKYGKDKGKLIIQPSKPNLKRFLTKIRQTIKQMKAVPTAALIAQLNRIIRGWVMYHRHICAKRTFNKVDYAIWNAIWPWCVRRHPKKGKKWVSKRYFTTLNGNRWTLFAKEGDKTYYLSKAVHTPIRRYSKIKATANPFVKEDEMYFERHLQRKMQHSLYKRYKLKRLFERQEGKCPLCGQAITEQTGWHVHHKLERYKGGKDNLTNLILLHPNCHYQVHHLNLQFDGHVLKDMQNVLEPCAGNEHARF